MKNFLLLLIDIAKDILINLYVDIQNAFRRFRKKPKPEVFDEQKVFE